MNLHGYWQDSSVQKEDRRAFERMAELLNEQLSAVKQQPLFDEG